MGSFGMSERERLPEPSLKPSGWEANRAAARALALPARPGTDRSKAMQEARDVRCN
jgi:hypothetical protein